MTAVTMNNVGVFASVELLTKAEWSTRLLSQWITLEFLPVLNFDEDGSTRLSVTMNNVGGWFFPVLNFYEGWMKHTTAVTINKTVFLPVLNFDEGWSTRLLSQWITLVFLPVLNFDEDGSTRLSVTMNNVGVFFPVLNVDGGWMKHTTAVTIKTKRWCFCQCWPLARASALDCCHNE